MSRKRTSGQKKQQIFDFKGVCLAGFQALGSSLKLSTEKVDKSVIKTALAPVRYGLALDWLKVGQKENQLGFHYLGSCFFGYDLKHSSGFIIGFAQRKKTVGQGGESTVASF